MNWRAYQNELIVAVAFVVMLMAFGYKQSASSGQAKAREEMQRSVNEINEVIDLKAIWGDKNLPKKIAELKNSIASSKVNWTEQRGKLKASYKELTALELNQLGKKVMNLAVEIERFEIKKNKTVYDVELQCKW